MLEAGRQRRDAGLEEVEGTNSSWVKTLRNQAVRIAKERGEVSIDDLRIWADVNGIRPEQFCEKCKTGVCDRVHKNSWGAVFKTGFVWTGKYKQSEYTTNNARDIKVWALATQHLEEQPDIGLLRGPPLGFRFRGTPE